jgi:hypothetical protein
MLLARSFNCECCSSAAGFVSPFLFPPSFRVGVRQLESVLGKSVLGNGIESTIGELGGILSVWSSGDHHDPVRSQRCGSSDAVACPWTVATRLALGQEQGHQRGSALVSQRRDKAMGLPPSLK